MAVRFTGAQDKIAKDPRIAKFRKAVKLLRTNDQSVKYYEEMRAAHVTRRERRATAQKLIENAQRDLIDMVMRNQSIRSRCVEMKMEIFNVAALIEDHLSALTSHLLLTYQGDIAVIVKSKTKTDRVEFIHSMFQREIKFLNQLKRIVKIADVLIDDLDQAGWAVQRTTAVLTLTAGRGKNI